MGVDANEIREGEGGAEDVDVRDGGTRNVRFGGCGVGLVGYEGLDVGEVATNAGAGGSFCVSVAVEGTLCVRIEHSVGLGGNCSVLVEGERERRMIPRARFLRRSTGNVARGLEGVGR